VGKGVGCLLWVRVEGGGGGGPSVTHFSFQLVFQLLKP